ncbi:helix-turn-helix transcriptional regulator [Goodfellowiella coeruleoviolacea]|nr:helix-turn-helix transcriptional regulator [Goodfellowiella coeruleoviolacea]
MEQHPTGETIGEFLRARRARIRPEELGLPSYGRRRVPGLRREELAQLAGVSVDYYVRLEQGRSPSVSDAVLDAIGRVLRLDRTEQAHLRALVRPGSSAAAPDQRVVRPGLRRVLEMMTDLPAFVLGRRMDFLAWNRLGDAVMGFERMAPADRNAARYAFLHPEARAYYPNWAEVAEETVAHLHLDAGRYPDDPELAALLGELSARDETFRRLWARHDVREKSHGRKLIRHPVVGELDLGYETFPSPGDVDQLLVVYTAEAGSATQERLRLLASWRADGPERTPAVVPGHPG